MARCKAMSDYGAHWEQCRSESGHDGPHLGPSWTWGAKTQTAPGEFGQYSELDPQPIDVILKWNLPYLDATALKYLSRHRKKGGKEDLEKAIWFIQKIIDTEYSGQLR